MDERSVEGLGDEKPRHKQNNIKLFKKRKTIIMK